MSGHDGFLTYLLTDTDRGLQAPRETWEAVVPMLSRTSPEASVVRAALARAAPDARAVRVVLPRDVADRLAEARRM